MLTFTHTDPHLFLHYLESGFSVNSMIPTCRFSLVQVFFVCPQINISVGHLLECTWSYTNSRPPSTIHSRTLALEDLCGRSLRIISLQISNFRSFGREFTKITRIISAVFKSFLYLNKNSMIKNFEQN